MREYILTPTERKIIQTYLETGQRLEGYSMLLNRLRKLQPIKDDLKLIQQFLAKVKEKKTICLNVLNVENKQTVKIH